MSELPRYDDAVQRVLAAVGPIGESQTVPLVESVGDVLARDIIADRDLPPFDRSQLDGYAVVAKSISTGVLLPVSGTIVAGTKASEPMPPGTCMSIATGAPLPLGADAVVGHEDTDRGDPVRFACSDVSPGAAVHPRGVDARDGVCLIEAGTMLGPQHLGIAASCGLCEMEVRRRPRCMLLTTGDEVVASTETPSDCQIRNGNAPMLTAALEAMGAEVCDALHLPDTVDDTNAAICDAIACCDMVVTVGGISEGSRDHVLGAMHAAGGEVVLRKAAIQPGKPITVARCGERLILALPGNPVSALACVHVFGWPIVRAMLGVDPGLPWRDAELGMDVKPHPHRESFRPCRIELGRIVMPA